MEPDEIPPPPQWRRAYTNDEWQDGPPAVHRAVYEYRPHPSALPGTPDPEE